MSTPEEPASSDASSEGVSPADATRRTRRAFVVSALVGGTGIGALKWLTTRAESDGVAWPFRKVLGFNESVSKKVFNADRMIPERPVEAIWPNGPRVNGDIGLDSKVDPATWRLRVAGSDIALTIEQLHVLPQVTQITPLNCIEGWTTVARWTGVRLADFTDHFFPSGRKNAYVGLETPGADYYVGLDASSAFHPQTLLCYAINNEPISADHGAPLRLLIPTKYGIKNLKRVGTIRFSDGRPRDYWAERGYDYFAGF